MRPIKFRAWDNFDRKMITNFDGGDYDLICHPSGEFEAVRLIADGCSTIKLLQFTGLHDKNGKEIFEGDIVRFVAYEKEGVWKYHGKVIWDEKTASFQFEFTDEVETHNMNPVPMHFPQADIEVLGNIYENPKLLT